MKKKVENKVIEPIDVHDDDLMVSLGIRHPNVIPRDPEVWTKNNREKKLLRKFRNKKHDFGPSSDSYKCFPLYGKLIIRIKKHSKFKIDDPNLDIKHYKTTFSANCYQYDIPRILNYYKIYTKAGELVTNLVINYTWNGKTYNANELPFRGW